jgi:hypothetical protein
MPPCPAHPSHISLLKPVTLFPITRLSCYYDVTLSFRYTERKLAFISFSIYHLEEDSVMFVSLGRKALRLVKTAFDVSGQGAGGN